MLGLRLLDGRCAWRVSELLVGSVQPSVNEPEMAPFFLLYLARSLIVDLGPVRRFKINKLHGYKDVEIEFSGKVLVLIAGNGSGKTTILNTLHAFLRRRFSRLQSLDFESIECVFRQSEEVILLSKSQVSNSDFPGDDVVEDMARFGEISVEELQEYLLSEYDPNEDGVDHRRHPIIRRIFQTSPWGMEEIDERMKNAYEHLLLSESDELKDIGDKISKAMDGIEIVYMPTYRRIENPMLSPRGRYRRNKLIRKRQLGSLQRKKFNHAGQMNYGLEDVEARLEELSNEVERISNLQYRSASATIIDDALADTIASTSISFEELPDLGSLTRFLQRVSSGERNLFFDMRDKQGEDRAYRRISAITELYESGRINDPGQNVLRYFLSRLGSVIEKTKETEAMLQRFVEACNSYLLDSSDEKSFVYEPNGMRVTVVNTFTDSVVPLGQLSSGEKQVISMLAHVYLYNFNNLILIDEPELSLSLDWQRQIIPDMMNSGSVIQLLAITHSPFIFDNEFDPYAGAMNVVRHREPNE